MTSTENYSIGFTRLMNLGKVKRNKMMKTLMEKMFVEVGSIDLSELNRDAKMKLAFMSETEFKTFKKSL